MAIRRARPAAEVLSPSLLKKLRSGEKWTVRPLSDADFKREQTAKRKRGERGKQVAPTKKLVSLRLSANVLEHFKASGPGWQTRIDETLKRAVGRTGR